MERNFIALVTIACSNAEEHYEVLEGDTNLAMKVTLFILPVGTHGTNKYINDGMCIHLQSAQIKHLAHHLVFANLRKDQFEQSLSTCKIFICLL
jgi:hypothetical protein